MHYRAVSNRNITFDCIHVARITMDDASVLDVYPFPNHDGRYIAANDSSEPHATFGAKLHIAGDRRPAGQKGAGRSFTKPIHA